MVARDVWQGTDRIAFHENAILLDLKFRTQGLPIKDSVSGNELSGPTDGLSCQLIRNFLDDFALVLAGPGGSEKVSAVCMETDEEHQMVILRASRNDGIDDQKLSHLQRLVEMAVQKTAGGSFASGWMKVMIVLTYPGGAEILIRYEEILTEILRQCYSRFRKHATCFFNELKQARYAPHSRLRFPAFSSSSTVESAEDVERLGAYHRDTHIAYVELCRERLCNLRNMCSRLATAGNRSDVSTAVALATAAYEVRRSSLFKRFLHHNILATRKPSAVQSIVQNLVERIGKMSRFWRAAASFVSFGSILAASNRGVQILPLPISRLMVEELSHRTPAQLRTRGGRHFQLCSDYQLQSKLSQYTKYRLHCEIQLIIFYQENHHLQLRSSYIGCDKLACYLCHLFITALGQFQVRGCHQGLYSLWTVPQSVKFQTAERANSFQGALRTMANRVEAKMQNLRQAPTLQQRYKTNHESTANLSRISLQLPTLVADLPETTRSIDGTSSNHESADTVEIGEQRETGELFSITENLDGEENPDNSNAAQNPSIINEADEVAPIPKSIGSEEEPSKGEACDQTATQEATHRDFENSEQTHLTTEQPSRKSKVSWDKSHIHLRDREKRRKRRRRRRTKDVGQGQRTRKTRFQNQRPQRQDSISYRTRRRSGGRSLRKEQSRAGGLWHWFATMFGSCFPGCFNKQDEWE